MGEIVSASSGIGAKGKKQEGRNGAYGFLFLAITLSGSASRGGVGRSGTSSFDSLPICSFRRQGKSDQSIADRPGLEACVYDKLNPSIRLLS
jgi:hypothetical protein